jgi:DNA helicase-2/ATP-dependent DNA helicase PcrA
MPVSHLLASLNAPQRDAVVHEAGPLLILAGAGSGKTRVLAHRVAYLIRERHVPPSRILAVTFTNKAANEMKARIEPLAGGAAADAWIGTFHRTCSRILRRHGTKIGIDPRFLVYDTDDQRAAVRDALRELGIDEKRFVPAAVHATISSAKNEGLDAAAYDRAAQTYFERVTASVWRVYQRLLAERSALDFDDLLLETQRLFDEAPDVLAAYQERFLHVLVDEYQDTNRIQFSLVARLSARHRNLCVVGDADQSIYAWRGADIRNILEFERDFPDARIIRLEQNYRSTKRILRAAEHLIRHNPRRYDKRLWTENPDGESIHVYAGYDEHDESRFVVDRIEAHHAAGTALRAVAVLYRINAMSRQFEDQFIRAGIPYQIVGSVRFYERKEVKDLLAYLRAAINPRDTVSLRRVANVPRRGLGDLTLARIETAAAERGIGLLAAMRDPGVMSDAATPARRAVAGFVALMDRLAERAAVLTAAGLIERAIDDTGYRSALEQEGTDDAASRLENLRELITVAQEFESTTGDASVEGFLEHLALVADADTYDEKADRVTLMTLHAAKGLEFPIVFLCGLEEGVFPHSRSLDEPKQVEEERRLAYVGITRARERLYLTHAQLRTLFGRSTMSVPSRFLREIPEEALAREQTPRTTTSTWTGLPERDIPALAVGESVSHRHFGIGKVLELEGEGAKAVATVHFPQAGTKRLALGYAPLEKVAPPA